MKLRVKYTAQLRTAIDRAEEVVELPAESRVTELLAHLAGLHQAGQPHLQCASGDVPAGLLIVVNESAVSARDASSVRLNEGDVVTLLPPIAGG